jgi:proteasome lid subunit RPN8/RPN11
MSKNIGFYKLSDEIVKLMQDKIDDTQKTKRETGFIICKNTNNELTEGIQCIGNRCYTPQIKRPRCNNPKDDIVGLFHTHPKGTDISGGDFAAACGLDIFCLGTITYHPEKNSVTFWYD